MGFLGIGDNAARMWATQQTNATNMALAKQGQSFEREMWNLQNAYNTPEAQMARFKAAGLNPNLIYGGGSGNAGNATTMPRAHVPDYKSPLTDFQMPDVVGILNGIAQLQKTNAETKRIESDTLLKNITGDVRSQDLTNLKELSDFGYYSSKAGNEHLNFLLKNRNFDDLVNQVENNAKLSGVNLDKASIEKVLKELELQMQQELKQFNLTGSDNPLYRLLIKMLNVTGIMPDKK